MARLRLYRWGVDSEFEIRVSDTELALASDPAVAKEVKLPGTLIFTDFTDRLLVSLDDMPGPVWLPGEYTEFAPLGTPPLRLGALPVFASEEDGWRRAGYSQPAPPYGRARFAMPRWLAAHLPDITTQKVLRARWARAADHAEQKAKTLRRQAEQARRQHENLAAMARPIQGRLPL